MMRIFRNWWVLTIFAAVVAILLLCVGLPMFVAFLRPTWVRVTCALLVLGVWGLLVFLRIRKARKAASAIAAELTQPSAADEESNALAARMREAMTALKSSSGKSRDYLYTKPWYVIIGPPGSGKTTALINSGLRFPLEERALKGVGGTRNLDFWFSDQAAMVDTAGRYTTQDSDYAVDNRGWTSFLSLLKKHRPLQPINGIIVAIGIDELIRSDCAGIDAHASAVRRRLAELRSTLEVAAPVYLMLTKADLLAGFTEYYDDLDVEGRRAVLGSTLPFSTARPSMDELAQAFDEMAQAVADRQAKRLFEEMDAPRRSLLLGFPSQLQSLRSRLMRFMDGAFVSGEQPGGVLRGFYLTSGVQEGAPLDRILSGMADVYDRPQQVGPGASGRAYFLNRLLTEVMFEEAGLVSMDPKARARQKARLVGALAAVGVLSFLTVSAWSVSFARNRAFQNDLLDKTTQAEVLMKETGVDLVEVSDSDADMRAALPFLNALRDLPRGYAERKEGGPPLTMRFGLYQSSLSQQAEETYREALRRVMLPRLLLRMEKFLEANRGNPMVLYEPLKVYLMLGGQGPMDSRSVRAWVSTDWATEVYPGSDSTAERAQLGTHLAALLEDDDLASVWPERRAALNGDLVASARAEVQTLDPAQRAYAVMRQKAASAGEPWTVAGILSEGDALAFANKDAVLRTQVPYFFTRAGYEKNYLLGLASVQQDVERDAWVLGSDAESVRSSIGNVRPGVAGFYARDYIAAWENVIKVMQPADYFGNPVAYGAFTKMPSPVKRVLLELRKNTIFQGGAGAVLNRAIKTRVARTGMGVYAEEAMTGRASGLDAGAEIATYFEQLHQYVGDGKQAAPIDEFVAAVREAGKAIIAAQSIGGGGGSDSTQAAMATATAAVRAAAVLAPPQMQEFATSAAAGGSSAQVSAATGAITDAYTQNVLPACREVAQERYPFFGGAAEDVAVVDALRVFGMGGVIEGFVQQRMMPLLDTTGPVWRWKADDPLTATLSPSSPEEFAKAGEVRELLTVGLQLRVSVEAMGSDVSSVEFSSGGQTHRFTRDAKAAKPIVWSPQGAYEAYVELSTGKPEAAGEAVRVEAQGPWALFRLMDKAKRENAGEKAIRATFGEGARSATLLVTLPTEKNPFSRGGLWSFRCPTAL